jgi:Fic family protein
LGQKYTYNARLSDYWDNFRPNTREHMSKRTKHDIEAAVLKLLDAQPETSVPAIADAIGLSKADESDRKAIRRVLNALIARGLLEARGAARRRTYTRVAQVQAPSRPPSQDRTAYPFQEIPICADSKELLAYVSRPIQARAPVGYNQNFLRAYTPNKTFFLSDAQRAELSTLGQVETKARPAGTYARNILNRLLIDLSWNSSRLEGNTYSLLETKRLIELGENAAGKDAAEAQMILNHKAAIEYIVESASEDKISFHEVMSIHALLSENLLGDPSASGRLRLIAVGNSGSPYMPLENPHVLTECFHLFVEKLNLIDDPFEQSLFSLTHLSYLQAFEDVNKRTARLVANIPLVKKNLNPLSFTDVDSDAYAKSLLGIYERNDVSLLRDLYIWAYKRSAQRYSAIQQAMGEPNLLKLKYRTAIHDIIGSVIREKIAGPQVVSAIKRLLDAHNLPERDAAELFKVIETEILSLHDGNIARFRIRPAEFEEWKRAQ